MSQIPFRANLTPGYFPFISEQQGQTTIVRGQDQNLAVNNTATSDTDKDLGIPQVYYMHNVLPTLQGIQSIGYLSIIPAWSPTETKFQFCTLVIDSNENKGFIAITTDGRAFFYSAATGTWVYVTSIVGMAGNQVSYAYIQGTTYLYVSTIGCYKYNFTTNTLDSVTLTGLTPSTILGITATNNYMIAWSTDQIAWSSQLTPVDFTPSTVTGAGGGGVDGARGQITICVPIINGMIVYTTQNAIAAAYSGNSRYPFNFRELVSSGGVSDRSKVSYDSNTGFHYAYTTSGLEMITLMQSQVVFPEVTDFLSGSYFEDFDETTLTFTRQSLSTTMQKQISKVADRYLVISYGITELTHALVFDMALKRWGKLKITHASVFEFQVPIPQVLEQPKNYFAFLKKDGSVYLMDVSFYSPVSYGVVILGKYQYVRQRVMQLDKVEAENIPLNTSLSLYDMYSVDGKNTTTAQLTTIYQSVLLQEWGARLTGVNHSLCFIGSFNLISLILRFNIQGKR